MLHFQWTAIIPPAQNTGMETGNNPITVPGSSNKPRLRFGQFTLRSLLIAMALVGAWFGGRVSTLSQLEAERRENETRIAPLLRNIDTQLNQAQTNANRWQDALAEVETVEDLYQGGRVTLDLVFEAERRRALARAAFFSNIAEYNKAVAEYINHNVSDGSSSSDR